MEAFLINMFNVFYIKGRYDMKTPSTLTIINTILMGIIPYAVYFLNKKIKKIWCTTVGKSK
ncbi:hypothetical protein bcere0022_5950 [Bacillus cereus Rock3-44]|nr:hypothetical protein bcere0022_5950 [Bacillus cereus Rock3-44]